MTLQQRIDLMVQLGEYMQKDDQQWLAVKEKASGVNPWFIPDFIELSAQNIAANFLNAGLLGEWTRHYALPPENLSPANVGLVMAGNIPLVGFHDMLAVFIAGHSQTIKPSSKDELLLKHLVQTMTEIDPAVGDLIRFAENLKGCDAYIATGSNNSGRYFEYYFSKYPHIIRRNRTSVAILTGRETDEELSCLADDIHLYFGLGCRNVTKLYVPEGYNFGSLFKALDKYRYYENYHKYKNNYDYQLALLMMSNKFYMTDGIVLLTPNSELFTAVSRVNYELYSNVKDFDFLQRDENVQCIVGHSGLPFGKAQQPGLFDYADGIDTMQFLLKL